VATASTLSPEEWEEWRQRKELSHPVGFAERWLASDVWGIQKDILEAIASGSKIAVKACHSSGKTYIAAVAVLWFLSRHSEAIVVTTAPTHNQVEKLLWGEIHSALARSSYPFPKATLTELKFGPKRYALGFTTSVTKQDEGVKFQGFHAENILVVLDEAPGVDAKIWEAIEGARAGGNVSILALGNPTIASGPFHESFHGNREAWKLFTISAFDTPNFDGVSLTYRGDDGRPVTLGHGSTDLLDLKEEELDTNIRPYLTTRRWVKEKFFEWGPGHPLWESRVCGNFPAQAEDALLSLAWLERAKNSERIGVGKVTAGLDVAGPGEDETVLTIRRGPQILLQKSWPQADPRGSVIAELNPYKPELEAVNVDSIGIGWGMYQHLLDHKFPARAVNVGESPLDDEKYANRKAELYWGLRMRLQAGDMSGLMDERCIGQLAGIRYKHNARGQVQIESKDDARKRGVKSPDRAESVMLAFASNNQTYGLIEYMKQLDKDLMAKRLCKRTNGHDNGKKESPLGSLKGVLAEPGDEIAPNINPLAKTNGHAPDAETPHTDEKIAVDIPSNVDRCPECKSVLVQRVAGGKRCGQCAHQWQQPGLRMGQVSPGQLRK
jgi:hypothetical protein